MQKADDAQILPSISQAINVKKCLVIGHTGDDVKSQKFCVILMCI